MADPAGPNRALAPPIAELCRQHGIPEQSSLRR